MKKVVKTSVMLIVLCLTVMSCSKESSAEQDGLYETQATEGDSGSDKPKRGGGD